MNKWYRIVPEYFNRRNYYKKFVREILEDRPLSDLKELESKREFIKFLFQHCPDRPDYDPDKDMIITHDRCSDLMEGLSERDCDYWYNYINCVIYIIINANEDNLKLDILEKFCNVFDEYSPETFINILFSLLLPEISAKESIYNYLVAFNHIYGNDNLYKEQGIDTGIERLNGILNYLYELKKEVPNDNLHFYSKLRIGSFIISYLYLNDIKDYSSIRNFLLHHEYYLEKLEINDCHILNDFGSYDFDNLEFLFNNFYDIFSTPKMIIK